MKFFYFLAFAILFVHNVSGTIEDDPYMDMNYNQDEGDYVPMGAAKYPHATLHPTKPVPGKHRFEHDYENFRNGMPVLHPKDKTATQTEHDYDVPHNDYENFRDDRKVYGRLPEPNPMEETENDYESLAGEDEYAALIPQVKSTAPVIPPVKSTTTKRVKSPTTKRAPKKRGRIRRWFNRLGTWMKAKKEGLKRFKFRNIFKRRPKAGGKKLQRRISDRPPQPPPQVQKKKFEANNVKENGEGDAIKAAPLSDRSGEDDAIKAAPLSDRSGTGGHIKSPLREGAGSPKKKGPLSKYGAVVEELKGSVQVQVHPT